MIPLTERTPSELERWKRIRLSVAAYAYEFCSDSIMSDAEFDALALSVDPSISTVEARYTPAQKARARKLDKFFKTIFSPHTGMWIRSHPELHLVAHLYEKLKRNPQT